MTKTSGLSSSVESIGTFKFRVLTFSQKLHRVAREKFTEVGCINCPIQIEKTRFTRSGKICFIDTLRYRFQRDVAPATEHIFAPSELLMIYFVYGDFQLSNPVGYGYLSSAKY